MCCNLCRCSRGKCNSGFANTLYNWYVHTVVNLCSTDPNLSLAIDEKDYIGGTFTLIFIPGQSASGNNLICVNLTILNDYLLEYNETFIVTLNSTQQDSNYIRISTRQNITLVTIIEDPQDGMLVSSVIVIA